MKGRRERVRRLKSSLLRLLNSSRSLWAILLNGRRERVRRLKSSLRLLNSSKSLWAILLNRRRERVGRMNSSPRMMNSKRSLWRMIGESKKMKKSADSDDDKPANALPTVAAKRVSSPAGAAVTVYVQGGRDIFDFEGQKATAYGHWYGEGDERNGCGVSKASVMDPYRSELEAALSAVNHALEDGVGSLMIRCNSSYLVNCMTKWIKGWKRKSVGWKTRSGFDVQNQDIIKKLDAIQKDMPIAYEIVRYEEEGMKGARSLCDHAKDTFLGDAPKAAFAGFVNFYKYLLETVGDTLEYRVDTGECRAVFRADRNRVSPDLP